MYEGCVSVISMLSQEHFFSFVMNKSVKLNLGCKSTPVNICLLRWRAMLLLTFRKIILDNYSGAGSNIVDLNCR